MFENFFLKRVRNEEKMGKSKKDSLRSYCEFLNEKVRRVDEDEVETAKLFEKLIKKYNLKKVRRVALPPENRSSSCTQTGDFFFTHYYTNREPVIITNLNRKIGKCIKYFDNRNILKHIGNTKVSIHVGNSKYLNNVNKNFRYSLSSLANFILLIGKEDKKKKKFSISYDQDRKHIYLTFRDYAELKKKKSGYKHELLFGESIQQTEYATTKGKEQCVDQNSMGEIEWEENGENERLNSNLYITDHAVGVNKIFLPGHVKVENHKKEKYSNIQSNSGKNTNQYYYYRSLGTNQFKEVSNIKKMNSFIRNNFFLPKEIYPPYNNFEFFSSVLRIGQTNIFIWLHYDIPDNFLIQIRGRKKILLIPPKFIKYFNIFDSSSNYNLFHILIKKKLNKKEQIVKKILKKFALVADIHKGDILFIPSLWLHYVYNMPFHTCVQKKHKSCHKHLHVVKENWGKIAATASDRSSCPCSGKHKVHREYHTIHHFYTKCNFKKIGIKKRNMTSSVVHFQNGQLIINRYDSFRRGIMKHARRESVIHKKKKKKRLLYFEDILFSCKNKTGEYINQRNLHDVVNDYDRNELIKHYSHLKNYEEYLKYNFHISTDSEESHNIILANKTKYQNSGYINVPGVDKKVLCVQKIEQNENLKHLNCATEETKNREGKNKSTLYENISVNAKLNISVNYFFRKRKERHLFSRKDLYGNQDIIVANNIFKKIHNEVKPLLAMSSKYKNFYLQKIQGLLYSYLDNEYI
ncbi:conserved Plasmodium protein, unknown function [Plasmodium ovale curtisi]|uniref:JmjC domain-containing protein n=2 Tax=Plasmodium ovale TaxID=36330 RepID=A0A1A8W1X2_PLAOA|nr:conserved Plasmodium protein, unknown function [Plasmodium ovale curtisi]SBS95709.1 conserved Plasmodium protein, unknown function [Plasmodium ovale curtisi]